MIPCGMSAEKILFCPSKWRRDAERSLTMLGLKAASAISECFMNNRPSTSLGPHSWLLFALESGAIKHFKFSSILLVHFCHSKHGASKKQKQRKMLCNFQQIEFLFLFDGDYYITFPSSLLFSDFYFLPICRSVEWQFVVFVKLFFK